MSASIWGSWVEFGVSKNRHSKIGLARRSATAPTGKLIFEINGFRSCPTAALGQSPASKLTIVSGRCFQTENSLVSLFGTATFRSFT
jgi:hypothetical protein